jgi:hypothetical protein
MRFIVAPFSRSTGWGLALRRYLYGVVVVMGLLLLAAPASAHKATAEKARKHLAKTLRGADSADVRTGKVRVTGCNVKRSSAAHRHAFLCRATVRLVYADGSAKRCTDKSVKVRRGAHRWRAKQTFKGYTCVDLTSPLAPAPPSVPTPKPPAATPPAAPPTDSAPPSPPPGTGPVGPPTGPPPLPPLQAAAAKQASQAQAALTTPKARAAQTHYYTWIGWTPYFPYNGYYWIYAQWRYTSLICNLYDDYYWVYWWDWSSRQWIWYMDYYRHFIYGVGYEYTRSPIC